MVERQQSHAIVRLLCYHRIRRLAFGLAITLGAGSLYASLSFVAGPAIHQKDMVQFYVLGRAILAGVEPYQPTHVLTERFIESTPGIVFAHPSPHPPTMALLFLPIALLSYEAASAIWFAVELACLAAAIALLARAEGTRFSVGGVAALTLAGLAWFPIGAELNVANVTLPLLALYCAAYVAERIRRPLLAAALVALSLLVKPLAWPILVVYLVTRRWMQLAVASLIGASGLLAAAIAIGPSSVARYFLDVLPGVMHLYRPVSWNGSIWTVATRVFQGTGPIVVDNVRFPGLIVPPLVEAPALADLLTPVVPLLIFAAFVGGVVRTKNESMRFGLAICASIILNPTFWSQYLALALLPLVQCFGLLHRRRFPSKLTNAALVIAILLIIPSPSWTQLAVALAGRGGDGSAQSLPFAPSLLSFVPTVIVIALGFLLVRLGREDSLESDDRVGGHGERRIPLTVEGHLR